MQTTATHLSPGAEKVLGSLSQKLQAAIERNAATEQARIISAHNRSVTQEAEAKRLRILLDRRIMKAETGLNRILQLGRLPQVQNFLHLEELAGKTNAACMTFFIATQPAIDEWHTGRYIGAQENTQVRILILPEYLAIVHSCEFRRFTEWQIPYTAPYTKGGIVRISNRDGRRQEQETEISTKDFLEEIATLTRCDLTTVQNFFQRRFVLEESDVTFQLLVSCARKDQFESYLLKCFERL